ncbi:oxygenase [Dictyobacter sp. S3.2.2.5]|uniref:Oxygenase n=2 Tax=Dictyobacter halimunensis TaxID=3026934 RepID=A0ABQ6FN54_9CHLR|nr:oxygenase [Dictyobacter sp. S3.2.2.5]
MNVYAAGKHLAEFHFAIHAYETPYEYPLFCSQVAVERVLTNHLAEHNVRIEWGSELLSFTQMPEHVSAQIRGSDGQEYSIDARYLVGCDGGHSRVRKLLHLPFEGLPDETWMVVDVNLDWSLPKDSLYAFLSQEGTVVAFPFPEGKRWRLLETVVGEKTDATSVAARFTRKINDVYKTEQVTVPEPLWMSTFTIQQRQVPNMRAGRCFVAGDAAHVHSPASGQGMNTGIQDAFNLAWKLALVIRGQATDNLLNSYTAEREPVASKVLHGAFTFTRVIGRDSLFKQRLRNLLLSIANTVPPLHHKVNRQITTMLSELDVAYMQSPIVAQDWRVSVPTPGKGRHANSELLPGKRVPDIRFGDTEEHTLFALMKGTRHTALLLTGIETSAEQSISCISLIEHLRQQYDQWLQIVLITPSEQIQQQLQAYAPVLIDAQGTLHRRLGAQGQTLYLFRPDGYVGYRNQPVQVASIDAYMQQLSGMPATRKTVEGGVS